MMTNLAPIALFVYNRCEHARLTVNSLKKNNLAKSSDLVIFSDAPKTLENMYDVLKVREYIYKIDGFKSIKIVERSSNFGLAKSIIDGVTKLVNQYGRVIVIEDDLITSPHFLDFMNNGLSLYENNSDVVSIHGYVFPMNNLPQTFFLRGADCWGWATWKDKWSLFESDGAKLLNELKRKKLIKRFDFNGSYPYSQMLSDQIHGKNNSWAIRWYASTFLQNKYTLYPGKSLVLNIGNDGSGTHCGNTTQFSGDLCNEAIKIQDIFVEDNKDAVAAFESYFRMQKTSFISRLANSAKKLSGRLIK